MGFFDKVNNALGKVGSFVFNAFTNIIVPFIKDTSSSVAHVVNDVYGDAKSAVSVVHDDLKCVVGEINKKVDNVTSFAQSFANNVVNTAGDVVKKGEDTIGNTLQTFAWPLVIGAAIVGIIVLK